MAPALLEDGIQTTAPQFPVHNSAPETPSHVALQPLCQIITPIGMLGYGFDAELTKDALRAMASVSTPTAVILDSGSTDSGPAKLALGEMTCPRSAYERDLRSLLSISHEFDVPVLVSSAGGDGTNAHVDELIDIIKEVSSELGNESYNFKTLAIYSDVPKSTVVDSLKAGRIVGCGLSVPKLNMSDIEDAVTIVAQMGPEPFLDAMVAEPDFDIIIGGRSYDPSPYIAFAIHYAKQLQETLTDLQVGGFTHMGKIMECGALCATPKSHSSMATVYLDGTFDIKPLAASSVCTPASVAAHTLYEKSRPDILIGPGGGLDLTRTQYDALPDGKSVRVKGGNFIWAKDENMAYTVKLEAAKLKGYRTMFMGGIRDPILIRQMDAVLERVQAYVAHVNSNFEGQYEVGFHVYGKDGIMGALEPGDASYMPREIFIVGEVMANTQEIATIIASTARVACVHGSYPEQRGTGGNLAMGIGGKLEMELGPCAEFCIYHLMSIEDGTEGARQISGPVEQSSGLNLFSWTIQQIGKAKPKPPVDDHESTGAISATKQAAGHSFTKHQKFSINSRLLTLADIAPVIRSKNSGPYDITLDVIFSSLPVYEIVKSSNLLSKSLIEKLYNLRGDEIIWCGFFDQAMAFKATIPRKRQVSRKGDDGKLVRSLDFAISGGYMETDVHASQQYVGLLELALTEDVKTAIAHLLARGMA
ncbi:hypothetical protein BP6252_04989 [Coleophoma cylindrospora]|uniref:Uncharacterized protein n=1 Tax=Coleophoma cylindrospora TaxID=1849047 RepID=A0A3D8RSK7_9HELO|nr:hypothetical protein BP6252_04989 [Coleophoma cylindrospora]